VATLWTNAIPQSLWGAGGPSDAEAWDVNLSREVVGKFCDEAWMWDQGQMTRLGTLNNIGNSVAYAINNLGQVAGASDTDGSYLQGRPRHAFLWEDGLMQDLGVPNTNRVWDWILPYDLNDRAQVVGAMTVSPGYSSHYAWLWGSGTMLDLNEFLPFGSGWVRLTTAFAINNAGQIVGVGYTNGMSAYQYRGFLLTPIHTANHPPLARSQSLTIAEDAATVKLDGAGPAFYRVQAEFP
jgi:probable HAF family extracellular repeat protein